MLFRLTLFNIFSNGVEQWVATKEGKKETDTKREKTRILIYEVKFCCFKGLLICEETSDLLF